MCGTPAAGPCGGDAGPKCKSVCHWISSFCSYPDLHKGTSRLLSIPVSAPCLINSPRAYEPPKDRGLILTILHFHPNPVSGT